MGSAPMSERTQEIRRQIERVYGSLEEPLFHFVYAVVATRPYDALRLRLAARFDVVEDTELNADVSFGLVLSTREGRCGLRLSMVGRYAMLLRLVPGAPAVVIASGSAQTADEAEIVAELAREDVELLDQATLDEHIPLVLFGAPRGETRLYQALFVDSDVIPWEWTGPPPAGNEPH
jgi:hypothetical protein